jgi:hypothetical protein
MRQEFVVQDQSPIIAEAYGGPGSPDAPVKQAPYIVVQ